MGAGGIMAGVRYWDGKTVVTIQDVLAFEDPFVFCAAAELSQYLLTKYCVLTSSIL